MKPEELLKLLRLVEERKLAPAAAVERLKHLPFEDIGFAKVDHHRALRQGYAEVVFGKGKTAKQAAEIVHAMVEKKSSRHNVLVTRADRGMFAAVKRVARKRGQSFGAARGQGVIDPASAIDCLATGFERAILFQRMLTIVYVAQEIDIKNASGPASD